MLGNRKDQSYHAQLLTRKESKYLKLIRNLEFQIQREPSRENRYGLLVLKRDYQILLFKTRTLREIYARFI